jgi:uncharacterized protein
MKIYVDNTKHNGKGLFAKKDIKSKEKIIIFSGKLMHWNELIKINNEKIKDNSLQINKTDFMVSKGKLNFLNHSCNPNAGIFISGKKVILKAIKDIKKDDEITFDYSTNMYDDGWNMKCNCKSKNCRSVVREFKQLPKNVKENYIKLGIIPDYNK